MLSYHDFRQKFLDFFQSKGHKIISSASLIPENDPTVLFTTAGMHPLVPYLLGEKHPEGSRLTNAQKCLRTDDIDEVGDRWHLTFFEMLGNWSLGYEGGEVKENGPYWKKQSIEWSWEFLTDKKWLGLDLQKIYVSVFAGDEIAPRDNEAAEIWQKIFEYASIDAKVGEGERIGLYGRAKNWWGPAGQTGPCGPDTEIFYDTGKEHDSKFGNKCHQNCDCGRFAEIWNNVFMQYAKTFDGDCIEMTYKNVDTGMGLERVLAIINDKSSVFETESFLPIIRKIEELSSKNYTADFETTKAMRIIADHLRAAVFILGDERGVVPSNIEQGYILRRLIRRAIRFGYQIGVKQNFTPEIARLVMQIFGKFYPELEKNQQRIFQELSAEEKKFSQTLAAGLKKIEIMVRKIHRLENVLTQFNDGDFDDDDDRQFMQSILKDPWLAANDFLRRMLELKNKEEIKQLVDEFVNFFKISGSFVFDLYTQEGFPPEMIKEVMLSVERPTLKFETIKLPLELDWEGFNQAFKEHQNISRAGAEQKFKGGLADTSDLVAKLHTATHLLQAALRHVLGAGVMQKGSNITAERLRFDFSYPEKMTVEQIKQAEDLVNGVIASDLPVKCEEMTVEEAQKSGAMGLFTAKYGERVRVYTVGDDKYFSREICGGPHASRTGELGHFKIIKEEASSAGVRRIKAILE
ncbi:MAG: Alanine-tRNA ligase [Candidatus Magasanikbacteria bacterium GW2011_GWC2_41_17]|uniref:Alanine--tRNA ligase n=1 Tax=Candidatus Magasanikbacteria bacterium GW2011_GWC2_41_17 TaxID=1619048 RepID=A0A0G0XS85_9BACT|nr:MAG: Alanine-tRNA ligase [Candidatus Magasanikbacteria bacterium GW2011_GWC2_41_17]